jgi:hypothetical protein
VLEKDGEDQMDGLYGNEDVLHKVKGERDMLHTIKRKKANWNDPILRRNCPTQHSIKGKITVKQRRGRRRKQLLD